jgi:hypothetical protein
MPVEEQMNLKQYVCVGLCWALTIIIITTGKGGEEAYIAASFAIIALSE